MQKHHIVYAQKNIESKDWIVEITGWQHKVLTHLQRMKATRSNLEKARNFADAVNHEIQRLAYQLYQIEVKNINPVKSKKEK